MKLRTIIVSFFILLNLAYCIGQADVEKINLHIDRAREILDGKSDSALIYASMAYRLADSLGFNNEKVESLFLKTRAYLIIGLGVDAYDNIIAAKDIIEANSLADKEPKVLMYTGLVYQNTGLTAEALKNFFAAEELYIEYPNNYEKQELFYYLGLTYFSIAEYKLSKEYLFKSIKLANDQNTPVNALKSYMLLADNQASIDSILYYYNVADQIVTEYEASGYKKVVLLNNIALLNKGLGNFATSKKDYQKAMTISINNGFKSFLSEVYNNYAYLMLAESKYDSAEYYLDAAISIAQEINNLGLEASIYDSYSDYYKAVNNYQKAYDSFVLAAKKKTEFKEKKQLQVSLFLSTVYETEKKEKEILQKENQISQFRSILFGTIALITVLLAFLIYYRQKTLLGRARVETVEKEKSLEIADALIEGQDVERKRLAMDLHDGLGARLGSLRFMIDAFVKGNPNFDEISNSVIGISKHVRDLSHRMLPTQLEELGLVASLQNLVGSMDQTSGLKVEMEAQVEERLSPKHETNLYYLTYELINNAIKHSGGNSIFIQLFGHTDSVTLSVEDNGNGFDTTLSKDGLGLKNIKQRVEYLKGELIVDSRIGEGTIFMIEVPIF